MSSKNVLNLWLARDVTYSVSNKTIRSTILSIESNRSFNGAWTSSMANSCLRFTNSGKEYRMLLATVLRYRIKII
ncbi:hypothetical protein OGAPHI_004335 [Ogataea philodendri]|uniref:Uncharacterized protein n=1 Tax=Ogataea philodendri TaxID=1378263 RepID=A0A9P8P6W0_9ASCO|nr:uncharacterized protein OGAPHI_004335 [Ogataea philodendri]KAH3666146.1 hypothetical protein OGAPHI_004335 [Ogataea philodendri]